MEGIFGIYKPKGPTSHDIINQFREITGIQKIGHAGTLDPLAEGVLVIAIGKNNTKKLFSLVKKEKEYLATIKLGEESSTDDQEGEKTTFEVANPPELKEIKRIIIDFKGEIMQKPPTFSAVKISGERSYKLARKGEKPEPASRKVIVKEIEIVDYEYPYLKLKIVTGPGVYIRSLARDIGKELEIGGYLTELKRIRVGNFNIENSLTLDQFKEKIT